MAIRWDKFTVKSQEAVQQASTLAADHGNPELLPLHLLAALMEDRDGVIVPVLEKLGVPTTQLKGKVGQAARDVERTAEGARPGGQVSRVLQGRVCLDRAPVAGARGAEERRRAAAAGFLWSDA